MTANVENVISNGKGNNAEWRGRSERFDKGFHTGRNTVLRIRRFHGFLGLDEWAVAIHIGAE